MQLEHTLSHETKEGNKYHESIIREIIIIKDDSIGDHYISLITAKKNQKELETLSAEFEDFKDKE